jgi:hypothetical protein
LTVPGFLKDRFRLWTGSTVPLAVMVTARLPVVTAAVRYSAFCVPLFLCQNHPPAAARTITAAAATIKIDFLGWVFEIRHHSCSFFKLLFSSRG